MSKAKGARNKLRDFFFDNVGIVLTSEQLREVAQISEWARRIRELRNEEGLQILTHNDRDSLKPGEYLLETLEPKPVIARAISSKLRQEILDRNGFTCQACGAGAGEESGCEPGKKCRLQIDHIQPISHGGTDSKYNLQAVCAGFNKGKANLKVKASREAISLMSVVRKQPRNIQIEVYEFLKKKFGD
ncbi:HNH endonuclease [Mucisphaera sp.]|uniref:HNH endonuclease n=1 Tax=Mucisphaera sp. TaxID=2913024 RepID=UPI003D10CDB2